MPQENELIKNRSQSLVEQQPNEHKRKNNTNIKKSKTNRAEQIPKMQVN